MMQTLSELVSSVLSSTGASMKIASSADAGEVDNLDEILGLDTTASTAPAAAEPTPEPKAASKTASLEEILDDAEYAMKLADALDNGSAIVSAKLANSPLDAPGPAIDPPRHLHSATVHPKAVTSSVPEAQKSHGSGPLEMVNDQPNGMQTNKKDYSSPDDKKMAALRLVSAKIAQAEQFLNGGDIDMAQQIFGEVKEMQAKIAADPSSPQASLPPNTGSDFKLQVDPPATIAVPDNAGMISMTRASARDGSTRETTRYFQEPPKKDNAVAAHIGTDTGLKVSEKTFFPKGSEKTATIDNAEAARAYLKKQASTVEDPNASDADKKVAADIINLAVSRFGEEQVEQLLA